MLLCKCMYMYVPYIHIIYYILAIFVGIIILIWNNNDSTNAEF